MESKSLRYVHAFPAQYSRVPNSFPVAFCAPFSIYE